MADSKQARSQGDQQIEQQAEAQSGGRKVRVHVDERDLKVDYANAFRTHGSADEVILDFGLNITRPETPSQDEAEMTFKVGERVIMNFYTAKRLAIALGQAVRRHEEQFGELQLNPADRQKSDGK